ncbi:helix-turn-helix transcriptional regulator [Ciceribacter ferrooxidans]|uniref:helix-turn-helix transcriptional regulator n=1 Tax=Ciceribacter ferrooxidans TaxID=2509717 RepID=UPI0026BA52BC
MQMMETRAAHSAHIPKGELRPQTILMIAKKDLLSECLAEVLSKKFPTYDVVIHERDEAVTKDVESCATLVLLYRLPFEDITAVLQRLKIKNSDTSVGIVVESISKLECQLATLAESREIAGVLPANLRLDVFVAAVELLVKGGEHFPSALLHLLSSEPPSPADAALDGPLVATARPAQGATATGDTSALTTREVQILDLICDGRQNKIIADRLGLSENTVKVHIRNIYKKMKVRNRTEAASHFFGTGRSAATARQN